MNNKVIAVLERAEALILADRPVTINDIDSGLWTNTVDAEMSAENKLNAAIDREQEELIEAIARDLQDTLGESVPEGLLLDHFKDMARVSFAAVIRAIEEERS